MANLCSRPPGFAAPSHHGDFCGTRLQNRLDRAAVDSACPPAGSINSACQIFSLLCWAHSVAEQCINIHGDQSRASGGRVWCGGVYMSVCVWVCVERWRDKQPEFSRTTHNQQAVIFLPTSLCRLTRWQKISSCLILWCLSTMCTHSWLQFKEVVIWVTFPFYSDYTVVTVS